MIDTKGLGVCSVIKPEKPGVGAGVTERERGEELSEAQARMCCRQKGTRAGKNDRVCRSLSQREQGRAVNGGQSRRGQVGPGGPPLPPGLREGKTQETGRQLRRPRRSRGDLGWGRSQEPDGPPLASSSSLAKGCSSPVTGEPTLEVQAPCGVCAGQRSLKSSCALRAASF